MLDTSASSYMCSDLNLMKDTQQMNIFTQVYLPDGTMRQVKHTRKIKLHKTLLLTEVLHIPSFQYNLISV